MNRQPFGGEEVLVRLPEITLGVTGDGKHLAIQLTTFLDADAAIALAHGIEDTAAAMKAGYTSKPAPSSTTDTVHCTNHRSTCMTPGCDHVRYPSELDMRYP